MAKKLKNLQALEQMLAGTHKSQTKKNISLHQSDKDKHVLRKVGDKWTDSEGKEWEQMKGYKVQNNIRVSAFERPRNCAKEQCSFGWHKLDRKFDGIHGLCFDCGIKKEHEMRTDGTWEAYEKERVGLNIKAWLKDAEQEVEELKDGIKEAYEYVNEDGTREEWKSGYDVEGLKAAIDKEFEKTKKELLEVANGVKDKEILVHSKQ